MRTIMQVLTLEGWSDLTYNYSDANDPVMSVIFFEGEYLHNCAHSLTNIIKSYDTILDALLVNDIVNGIWVYAEISSGITTF